MKINIKNLISLILIGLIAIGFGYIGSVSRNYILLVSFLPIANYYTNIFNVLISIIVYFIFGLIVFYIINIVYKKETISKSSVIINGIKGIVFGILINISLLFYKPSPLLILTIIIVCLLVGYILAELIDKLIKKKDISK